MKLVIAEKPSVAMSLAAVLGANEKKDGYMEGGGYLVSWCVGHLLELAQPEAYGEQYARWCYGDLPILPEEWKYEVPKDKKKQLDLLCRLMKDKRVNSVVCATDAGREGELIFRLVYEHAGCKKPIERLWISSMEDAAIRDGVEHLRPGSDYDKLYDAAVCRAGADWLIGINATRLFSVLYGVTLNVGRVMSPTLAFWYSGRRIFRHLRASPSMCRRSHAAVLLPPAKNCPGKMKLKKSVWTVTGRTPRYCPWKNRSKRCSRPACMT